MINYSHDRSDIPEIEIFPGFYAKFIHTDQLTIAFVRIKKGSQLPEHFHIHEQVTTGLEGELEMTVGGQQLICKAGVSVSIPSNTPHSAVALSDCLVMDVFSPPREDYQALTA